jgi:GH35 family endo-1,4-beta-xylanase
VIADDESAGTSAAYIHRRTDTFYDGAVTFDENNIKLTDGYPPQSRTYTSESAASTFLNVHRHRDGSTTTKLWGISRRRTWASSNTRTCPGASSSWRPPSKSEGHVK